MQKKLKYILSESTFFIFGFYFSRGLRIAFAMMFPILVGWITNHLEIGILASSGALVAGIGDNPGPIKLKFYTQLVGAVFYFLVLFISQLLLYHSSHTVSFGIWITFCGFFFSMFFIYGSRAVSVGTSALLCIVYACSFHTHNIYLNTLGIMLGIIFYGVVSLGLWRIQPYRVIEQKISENIKQLSEYIKLLYEYFRVKNKTPDKKEKLNELLNKLFEKQEKIHATHEDIRENLFKLRINAKSFSTKGRRMTLVFSALIDLYEQLISLNLQDDKPILSLKRSGLVQNFRFSLLNMQHILESLAWSINLNKKVTVNIDTGLLDYFKTEILKLEQKPDRDTEIDIHSLKHIRFLFKSFYKQTRIIKSIINGEFASDEKQYEDLDLEKFTRQYNYNFSTFKANLNLRSNIFRHALRMGLAVLLAYIACTLLEINYFSWVFLTIILILKPDYGNTKNFSLDRLQGTLIGAAITVLILLTTRDLYVISAITFLCIIGAYSFIPVNYKTGVAFVTIFVILLIFIEHQGSNNLENIYHRLGGTAIAIAIAFILSFIFLPTWEYKKLPATIGKSINYNLKYFQKISHNLLSDNKLSDTNLKLVRKEVLLSVSNLSGAFQRIVSEPKLSKEYKSSIYNVQTLINLLSTRISSLRTYSSKSNEITENDKKLIGFIETTLQNCVFITKGEKINFENTWKEDEINLSFEEESLVTYQLKEINTLSQQIYNYLLKLGDFLEWKNAERKTEV